MAEAKLRSKESDAFQRVKSRMRLSHSVSEVESSDFQHLKAHMGRVTSTYARPAAGRVEDVDESDIDQAINRGRRMDTRENAFRKFHLVDYCCLKIS